MKVNQRKKERFCGYCNSTQYVTWEEMEAHLHICEELNVAKYKLKNKPKE